MKFKKDIKLDAVLVHARIHGLYEVAAIGLGLTASEAYNRSLWLRKQSSKYIDQVSDKVVKIEEIQ